MQTRVRPAGSVVAIKISLGPGPSASELTSISSGAGGVIHLIATSVGRRCRNLSPPGRIARRRGPPMPDRFPTLEWQFSHRQTKGRFRIAPRRNQAALGGFHESISDGDHLSGSRLRPHRVIEWLWRVEYRNGD